MFRVWGFLLAIGIFKGFMFFWNPEDSKNWFAENTKIPRQSKLVKEYRHVFNNLFDLTGFTYVLRFFYDSHISNIYQDSTTEHYLKAFGEANCFGSTRFWKNKTNMSSTLLMSGSAMFILDMLDSPNVEIWKRISVNLCHLCSCMCWRISTQTKKWRGPGLMIFLKFQKWSQKHWNMSGALN